MLIAIAPAAAMEETIINFNTGYFGIGGNFPLGDSYDLEGSVTLINIGMENRWINIGFEFSPLQLYGWSGGNADAFDDITGISLFNMRAYWTPLSLLENVFYLGPFTSVSYFFVNDAFLWNRYVFTAGGQAGLRLAYRGIHYNIFVAEAGYRNINGRNKYYVGAKIDILAFLLFAFMAQSD